MISEKRFLRRFQESDFLHDFKRSPVTIVSFAVVVVLFLLAVFAELVAPTNPFDVGSLNLMNGFTPPMQPNAFTGEVFPLGTDDQGRDLLSAIIFGLRVSLFVGLTAVILAMVLGVSLGLLVWQPHLHWFVGLSGLLHGLFVLGLWPQARQHERVAQLALVLLAGKLLMEVFTGASVSDEALVGGRVITASHAFGAVSAVIFLLACEALTRLRGAVNVSTPDTSTKHK